MFRNFSRLTGQFTVIGVILTAIFLPSCDAPSVSAYEQKRQQVLIEQLSKLEPYDMVMLEDGKVWMVAYPIDKTKSAKADWKLTLRAEYMHPVDYQAAFLSMWATRVYRVFPQNEIYWNYAAKCYLKDEFCRKNGG